MKILHVVSNISPRYGGPAKICKEIAHRLNLCGVEADIYTTNQDYPEGILSEEFMNSMIRDNAFQIKFFPVEIPSISFSFSMAFALFTAIRKYDLVHIHGLYRFPQTFAALCARLFNKPYIIRPHGSLDPYLFRQKRHQLLKRIYEFVFDLPNLKKADGIHFTTVEEMELTDFLQLGNHGFVLPNGIDAGVYQQVSSSASISQIRKDLDVPDTAPIVLFLGRLHFKKGLDLLIPAFADLHRDFPSANLVIVGPENDDYGNNIRNLVAQLNLNEYVKFPGMVSELTKIIDIYQTANMFVLPSYSENFGVSVIEAMATGLPVIVSDKVNIHREIQAANAGVVIPNEVLALSNAMKDILANPEKATLMGKNGANLVQSLYDWKTIIPDLIHHYQRILEDHSE